MSELAAYWEQEKQAAFSAYHVTAPEDTAPCLPWSYRKWLLEFLKPQSRLLDMGARGGAFLYSLRHPYRLTGLTEYREEDLAASKRRFAAMGATVVLWKPGMELPFTDNSFDLVINFHAPYAIQEVRRVLRPGGHFITEQTGAQAFAGICGKLGLCRNLVAPDFNLENQAQLFRENGFRVVKAEQCYPIVSIANTADAACFLQTYIDKTPEKQLPMEWKIRCRKLLARGPITAQDHQFILIGKKG